MYGQLGQGNTDNIGYAANQMGDYFDAIDLGTGFSVFSVHCGGSHVCASSTDQGMYNI